MKQYVTGIYAGIAVGVLAAPPARRERPAAKLVSIAVVPNSIKLVGPRSQQGLLVSGTYSDGRVRDLTSVATFKSSNSAAKIDVEEGRKLVRPVADGAASVTIAVPGAPPVAAKVQVEDTGELAPVSFRDEVVPAFTKIGCSAGTCHGTPTGKGGFRLSLQGYAPDFDYQSIAREGGGRRVNPADPGASLLLQKPMVKLPHAGGKRLDPAMPEFKILTRWIAEGARLDPPGTPTPTKLEILPGRRQLKLPDNKQSIVALAHFSDGSIRDVTHLTKLSTSDEDTATVSREGLVEGQRRGEVAVVGRYEYLLSSQRVTFLQDVPGFKWTSPPVNNYVDQAVYDRLKLFQVPPSGLSSDTEFLRRAYLDACGKVPTAEETSEFLKDPRPDKRDRLIDALTQRPEFADYWALKWADVLRVQDETLKEPGAKAYHKWIRDSIAANKPMNQFAREILTASGSTLNNPPANYFRAVQEPEVLADMTAQVFLGVRMGCAKCHNHPFERWTQDEYYELAAFFAQVKRRGSSRGDDMTIDLDPRGEVQHLRTGLTMKPKLLGANFVEVERGKDRRVALADWVAKQDNPFFAKAIVNRTWANLLGRGIVEPIDDFRDSNPPVNDALLESLAKDFAEHSFDLRYLVRTIMKSRTYQLTAHPEALNKADDRYFSHALPRVLQAEVLADAICQVTGVPDFYEGYVPGTRAIQLAGTSARTDFLKVFGRPDRNLPCECEREKEPNLFQALALMNGRGLHSKLKSDGGRIARLAQSGKKPEAVIDELYLGTFNRPPSAREKTQWLSYLGQAEDRRAALEDMGWVLINSKEFLYRH
jgi:hypothetical protein